MTFRPMLLAAACAVAVPVAPALARPASELQCGFAEANDASKATLGADFINSMKDTPETEEFKANVSAALEQVFAGVAACAARFGWDAQTNSFAEEYTLTQIASGGLSGWLSERHINLEKVNAMIAQTDSKTLESVIEAGEDEAAGTLYNQIIEAAGGDASKDDALPMLGTYVFTQSMTMIKGRQWEAQ